MQKINTIFDRDLTQFPAQLPAEFAKKHLAAKIRKTRTSARRPELPV